MTNLINDPRAVVRELLEGVKTLEQQGAIKLSRAQITVLAPAVLRKWQEQMTPADDNSPALRRSKSGFVGSLIRSSLNRYAIGAPPGFMRNRSECG